MFEGKIINHKNIYTAALFMLAATLPFSTLLMSIAILTLTGNWILAGNFKTKFQIFFTDRIALIVSSIFLLHLIGLIYTTDFSYALKDLRLKIPLLVLPLIISSSEKISKNQLRSILKVFIAAVVIASLCCFFVFLTKKVNDIREISIFISHIRFSLLICFSIFILIYWAFTNEASVKRMRFLYVLPAIWLITFLFILESFTGISILLITSAILLIRFLYFMKNKMIRAGIVVVFIAAIFFLFSYVKTIYNELNCGKPVRNINYSQKTLLGHKYTHDTLDLQTENCNYVLQYISEFEMSQAWNKVSKLIYSDKDNKGQYIRYTLMRYLTSKGLHKDAEGVNSLSREDIENIENGIANCELAKMKGVKARIYELMWELKNYHETGNPNGHSLMLRILYWKASLGIIRENILTGVGTGDMNSAFDDYYKKTDSSLDKEWRLRSHNQYLSFTVGFGVLGLIWFLFVLFYPAIKTRKWNDYYYLLFFIIITLSMLTEDTIESQAGLTFFVFFNSLFLLGVKKIEKNNTELN
jgi:5S rRNA maturation endonuclease (ribonuclease M5)